MMTYKGRNINDMNREELIEAISHLYDLYTEQVNRNKKDRDLLFSLLYQK